MSEIRIDKLEGHYTIKMVDKLPKRGNSNWLYGLWGEKVDRFYFWTLDNKYGTILMKEASIGHVVANLPIGEAGDRLYVTDALAPSYLEIIEGGGAITCPVFFNGTNWVSA